MKFGSILLVVVVQCSGFIRKTSHIRHQTLNAHPSFISDQSIKVLRERAKITEVAQFHNLELKRSGSSITCICPFHNDKRPSMTIDDEKNLFHCFACGAGGDIFKLVGELEGTGFVKSAEILANMFNVKLQFTGGSSSLNRGPGQSSQMEMKQKQAAIDEASYWFASKLLNPSAGGVREYLKQRKLSPQVVYAWGIGLSVPGATQHLLSLNHSTQTLQDIGVLGTQSNTGRLYEVFQHRLMVPVRDLQGKVVGFGGRQMMVSSPDSHYPKYINSKETSLFEKRKLLFGSDQAKAHARNLKCCVIVEGYFDVISLHSVGICNAVGCMGTALSAEQLALAHRLSNKGKVVLALDGDEAGQHAAVRICETLLSTSEHFDVRIASMPVDCKDASDVVTKHSAAMFQSSITAAVPWTEWYVHAVMDQFPGKDAATFSKRVDKLSDIIAQLPSPHMRTFNAFKFAQLLAHSLGKTSISHERQLELDLLTEATKKRKSKPRIF